MLAAVYWHLLLFPIYCGAFSLFSCFIFTTVQWVLPSLNTDKKTEAKKSEVACQGHKSSSLELGMRRKKIQTCLNYYYK